VKIQSIIEEHRDEIVQSWRKFCNVRTYIPFYTFGFIAKGRDIFLTTRTTRTSGIKPEIKYAPCACTAGELRLDLEIDNLGNPKNTP